MQALNLYLSRMERPSERDRNEIAAENRRKLVSYLPEEAMNALMQMYEAIPDTGIGNALTSRIDQSNDYFMNQHPQEVAENQRRLKDFFITQRNRFMGRE